MKDEMRYYLYSGGWERNREGSQAAITKSGDAQLEGPQKTALRTFYDPDPWFCDRRRCDSLPLSQEYKLQKFEEHI